MKTGQIKKPSPSFQKKKWKTAIKLLNDVVKIKIAPSPIEGVGIFAIRDIKEGEFIEADAIPHAFDIPYKMLGECHKEVREIILNQFPAVVTGSNFLYPVTRMQAFLNHSDEPNYDAKTDKTLRAIKKGEELTEDYRLIEGYEKVYPWLAEKKVV